MENLNNARRNNSSGSQNTIDEEVARLFKHGKVSNDTMRALREKYKNDSEIVEQIQNLWSEKYRKLVKKAKKFARLVREKYADQNLPFNVILNKAQLYQKKLGLSNEEFSEFKRQYEQDLFGKDNTPIYNQVRLNTNMEKVLGNILPQSESGYFDIDADSKDYGYLQEIFNLTKNNEHLHAQVLLQSIQFEDCAFEALTGTFDRNHGHLPGNHIHPVIAALFLPRFEIIDEHFIHANMGKIVQSRYEYKKNKSRLNPNAGLLKTRPDYMLFHSLVTDPNDIVCSNVSPIMDLMNRVNLQVKLWKSIIHLRSGQYYGNPVEQLSATFLNAIDLCKLNKYDAPDLIYGRYDGIVMKRLLAAFSFRPTVIATTPSVPVLQTNPFLQQINPQVTSIPMINLRIPFNLENDSINLTDFRNQRQWFFEGNRVIQKETELIYSRGILIFYVDRRSSLIFLEGKFPFDMGRGLPSALIGYERINTTFVVADPTFRIRNDSYKLRSVVYSIINDTHLSGSEMNNGAHVIGSATAIVKKGDDATQLGLNTDSYFRYDPYLVGRQNTDNNNIPAEQYASPMQTLQYTQTELNNNELNFRDLTGKQGVIFIYELAKDQSEGTIVF